MKNDVGFRGDYFFLSNMYPCKIKYNDKTYHCSETFYISMKFEENQTRIIEGEEINLRDYFSNMRDGKFRKREQKKYEIVKNWNQIKLNVMEIVVREKFKIPFLRNLLLKTENEELIENNTWNDTFWGVCNGKGENNLGKILMKIRKEIQLEINNNKNIITDMKKKNIGTELSF